MAKKPRSQRRKKGKGDGGGGDGDDNNKGDQEMLSEEHTIADSITTFSMQAEDENDMSLDDVNELLDTDDLINNKVSAGGDAARAESAAAKRELRLQDTLFGLDEFATEKQSSKREAKLRKLFKSLTQCAVGTAGREAVYEEQAHIRSACLYALRAGQPSEQYAACRCLEATSVVLGANEDEWVESLDKYLRRTVMMTTRATPVRMAALRALSMAVFIGATETETTEGLMDLTEQVASDEEFRNEQTPIALRATGLDCWALLATTVHDFYLAGQDDSQMGRGLALLSLLEKCLDTNSIDLRSAAGECLALIHEARLNLGVAADGGEGAEAAESVNTTARRYQRGSWDGSEFEETMDEVKQRIAELSVESGHRMSKKAKKEQRATFRDFMATLVDDEAPCEVISLRNHGSLTLNSWREIIQVNFIRHNLQGGFQIQLLTNPTLQAIFGAESLAASVGTNASLSQLEKRLFLSKTSEVAKNADRKMTRQRDKRQNVKNHFLTADGEDL